jgi:hypothetical protein
MRACLNEISKMLLPVDELGPRTLEYPDDSPEASESDESISQGQVTLMFVNLSSISYES